MKSGIYDNLDINEYHNDLSSISSTGINLILDCPARYYHEYYKKRTELGERELAKQAEKYKLGRAVHTLVLEPEKFDNTFYCMKEPVNLATKIGKEIYAQAETEAAGRDILRTGEWEDIKAMANALSDHELWEKLKDSKFEQSIFWEGGMFDTPLKARPDIFNDKYIVDIKTTESIKAFDKSMYDYGYHIQAAMQVDALKKWDGIEREFGLFLVEKKAPFLTACFTLPDEAIPLGRKRYLDGAAIYSDCMLKQNWGGYSTKFEKKKLPYYLHLQIENNNNEESVLCLT